MRGITSLSINAMTEGLNRLDSSILRSALRGRRIIWRRHALERMLERGIDRADVKKVVFADEQIECYPDAFPFPSALFVGNVHSRVLHVVAALDERGKGEVHVISAYEPDADHFESDMRTRKRRPKR